MHERQTAAYCMPSVHATILIHVFVVVEASKSHPVFSSLFPCLQRTRSCSAHALLLGAGELSRVLAAEDEPASSLRQSGKDALVISKPLAASLQLLMDLCFPSLSLRLSSILHISFFSFDSEHSVHSGCLLIKNAAEFQKAFSKQPFKIIPPPRMLLL